MIELIFILGVSYVLARFIQQTLSPLLEYYRSQGHFAVIHRVGGIASLIVIDVILVIAGILWVLSQSHMMDRSLVITVSYAAIIFFTSLIKILQPFVQADARDEIQTLALVRRIGIFVVAMIGIVLVLQGIDLRILSLFLAILQAGLTVQLLRIRRQYHKEITYRRQYEDSGHQESILSLVKTMSLQAISLLPVVILQVAAVTIVLWLPLLFEIVGQELPDSLSASLILILVTALSVRFVFHFITPNQSMIRQAEVTNNHSRLTKEATLWLERGGLIEVIMIIVVGALFGVILPVAIPLDYPVVIASLVLGYLLGIHAYLSHVFQRLSIIASSIISVTAIVLLLAGSFYYAVYFGYVGLLGSAIITMVYLYMISYVWAVKEYAIELKPHGIQLAKMAGLFLVGAAVLVVLRLVVPPVIEGLSITLQLLAMTGIVVLMEIVIIYAYVRVLGLTQYGYDSHQFKQQFDTIYLAHQEEEAIW